MSFIPNEVYPYRMALDIVEHIASYIMNIMKKSLSLKINWKIGKLNGQPDRVRVHDYVKYINILLVE
jgi:hypothetical protein